MPDVLVTLQTSPGLVLCLALVLAEAPCGRGMHAALQLFTICSCTGVAARQRKAELERLNEQLRKINMSLRQQARAGTVYAPGLNYAPIPMPASPFKAGGAPVLEDQRIKTINGVQVSAHVWVSWEADKG